MHKVFLNFYAAYTSELLAENESGFDESHQSRLELAAMHYEAAAKDLPTYPSQKPSGIAAQTSDTSEVSLSPSKLPTLASPSQKSSEVTTTPPTEPKSQDSNPFVTREASRGPSVRFVLPGDPAPQAQQTSSAITTSVTSLSHAMAQQRLDNHLASLKPLLRSHVTWINELMDDMGADEENGESLLTATYNSRFNSRNRVRFRRARRLESEQSSVKISVSEA